MEQPKFSAKLTRGPFIATNRAVVKKSQDRLRELKFDPLESLVRQYQNLEAELYYQECLREGIVEELRLDGKPKAYRADIHMGIYEKMIAIGEKLLRYQYGRVPETNVVEHKERMPLIVNLTKKGEVYRINDEADTMIQEGTPDVD